MREDGVHVSLDGHGGGELPLRLRLPLGSRARHGRHLLLGLVNGPSFTRRPLRALDLIRSLYGMQGPGSPERAGNSATLAALTYPALRAVARRGLGRHRRLEGSRRRHAAEPYSADAEALERLGPLTSILYQSFHRESLPRILR